MELITLKLGLIKQHHDKNPRKSYDKDYISELGANVAQRVSDGKPPFIQPIGVVLSEDGSYELVFGNCRLLGAIEGKVEEVNCILMEEFTDEEKITENVLRMAMSPLDTRNAYAALVEQGKNITAIARTVGKSVGAIKRSLSLLKLGDIGEALLANKQIIIKVAEYSCTLPEGIRNQLLERIAEDGGMTLHAAKKFVAYNTIDFEKVLWSVEDEGLADKVSCLECKHYIASVETLFSNDKAKCEEESCFEAKQGAYFLSQVEECQSIHGEAHVIGESSRRTQWDSEDDQNHIRNWQKVTEASCAHSMPGVLIKDYYEYEGEEQKRVDYFKGSIIWVCNESTCLVHATSKESIDDKSQSRISSRERTMMQKARQQAQVKACSVLVQKVSKERKSAIHWVDRFVTLLIMYTNMTGNQRDALAEWWGIEPDSWSIPDKHMKEIAMDNKKYIGTMRYMWSEIVDRDKGKISLALRSVVFPEMEVDHEGIQKLLCDEVSEKVKKMQSSASGKLNKIDAQNAKAIKFIRQESHLPPYMDVKWDSEVSIIEFGDDDDKAMKLIRKVCRTLTIKVPKMLKDDVRFMARKIIASINGYNLMFPPEEGETGDDMISQHMQEYLYNECISIVSSVKDKTLTLATDNVEAFGKVLHDHMYDLIKYTNEGFLSQFKVELGGMPHAGMKMLQSYHNNTAIEFFYAVYESSYKHACQCKGVQPNTLTFEPQA
jgi:ParB/RepB/Spo0J family partition protein